MNTFLQGMLAGAGGMVVLIGLLVIIPLRLRAWLLATRQHDRGLC
ncbi:hypothetical protein [Komagataeibacter sp. FNDCF1]|nr:hypothetical protein [Komagataeibacter sp. FNDCF1]